MDFESNDIAKRTRRSIFGDPDMTTFQVVLAKSVTVTRLRLHNLSVNNVNKEIVFHFHVLWVMADHHVGYVATRTLVNQICEIVVDFNEPSRSTEMNTIQEIRIGGQKAGKL